MMSSPRAAREHTYDASFWRQWQSKQQTQSNEKQTKTAPEDKRRRRCRKRPNIPEPLPATSISRGGAPVVVAARFGSAARFGETTLVDERVFLPLPKREASTADAH